MFIFFRCFAMFQLFLILHFLSFVEFQPACFLKLFLFYGQISAMFLIKVVLIKQRVKKN